MPYEITKGYVRRRLRSPRACAPGSFRTVKRGRRLLVICCPKGRWNRRAGRCRVGTMAQSVLTKRKRRR
jgi:hypothetical protein